MTNVFYCRISTNEQNDERQLEYAKRLGIDPEYIFNDHFTGTTMERKEMKRMREFLRKGDVVYVESISRLGRKTIEVLNLIEEWKEKGIHLVSEKERIDTREKNPFVEAMYVMFSLFSSMENEHRKQRCMEGIAIAKKNGQHLGRRKVEDLEGSKNKKEQIEYAVKERMEEGTSYQKLRKKYGVCENTIRRYIREHHPEYFNQ